MKAANGHEQHAPTPHGASTISKYDWCAARNLYTDEEMQAVYQPMGEALLATSRPIVYSLCQYGRSDVWKWGADVGGSLWRTTGDNQEIWAARWQVAHGP